MNRSAACRHIPAIALILVAHGHALGAGPPIHDFPLPDLRKGIWSITLTEDYRGEVSRISGGDAAAACRSPADEMRKTMADAYRHDCAWTVMSRDAGGVEFQQACVADITGRFPSDAGGKVRMQMRIESGDPEHFSSTTTLDGARLLVQGRRLRDCGEMPLSGAAAPGEIPAFDVHQGRWQITVLEPSQDGASSRHELKPVCADPAAAMRHSTSPMECRRALVSRRPDLIVYTEVCDKPVKGIPVDPDGKLRSTVEIALLGPEHFTVSSTGLGRKTLSENRRLGDCAPNDPAL